jgi:hypothetical protein
MQKPRKTNGKKKRLRGERESTIEARKRVFAAAKKRGIISSALACQVGKWDQAWFHLNAMAKAGHLRHAGYNQWLPGRAPR